METFMDKSSEARLSRYDCMPYRSTDPPVEMENLQEEVTKLVDHLTGIQKQLQLLSIVETSGTASCSIQLVDKVYEHPLIQSHFEIRQRTTFREEHQMSGLLQCILAVMGCGGCVFNTSDEILGEMLKMLLTGRRFLILLNNMRDKSVWDDLRRYVPDNNNGSKVMFTDWPASMGLIPQPCQYPLVQQEEDETYGVHLYLFEAHIISFDTSTSSIGKAEENVSNVKEEEIVGVEDEVMKLVERLTGEEKRLEVVSIVGMPGLGKTTLAKTVYNHTNVVYHFYVRAWTRVSQSYQKRDLLLAILSSIIELTSKIFDFTDVMLLELLRKRLLGRRYLVVMDDMWDFGAWDDLRRSFPDDKNGSKIMFTSRATNVAFHAQPNSPPYHLRFLTESESLQLLCRKVFQSKPCPSELAEIATEIAKKCKGLPLAIVVIAGILANEKTLTRWGQVAQSVNSLVVDNPEQYMDTLALSYNYLPLHLKSCFLYLGAFLEDREIPARKLILLWVAEGFIQQSGSKRLTEDVAEDFLMELINRSLIIVSRRGSDGRIKSCIIHDLLRELCLKKANEVKFMHIYEDKPSPSDPCTDKPSRLCIYSASSSHSSFEPFAPYTKALLCFAIDILPDFASFICQTFKLLRVLDLSSTRIVLFPREVVQLVDLRYFALQAEVGSPPSSISNLKYLETLIISSKRNFTLPKSIWKMVNLRHLCTKLGAADIEDLDGYPPLILKNLQTLSSVWTSQSCEDVLLRASHLRKLGVYGPLISESGGLEFPNLDSSKHLETLKLFNTAFYPEPCGSCSPNMYPERLKRLTLTNTALAWEGMQTLGMLPNLETLKLKLHACVGRQWETRDGGFKQLKYLIFQDLEIVQWIASSCHFPCLQQLVFCACRYLEEIPSSLGDIPTLEVIEVRWCSVTAANSAHQIKNYQKENGNDLLKVTTYDTTEG